MKKYLPTLEYFGEWNNILFYDCYFWFDRKVNSLLHEYFGEKRISAWFTVGDKEYLYFDKSYFAQLEEHINNWPQKKLLKQLQRFYPEFERIKEFLLNKQNILAEELSNEELVQIFTDVFKTVNEATPFDQYCMISERYYLSNLENYLKKQLSSIDEIDKFIEYQTILTTPSQLSSTQLEELSLLDIAIKIQKSSGSITENIKKDIENHVFNHGWLPVFLSCPHWDEKYIQKQAIKLANENDLESGLEKLKQYTKMQEDKVERLMSKLPEESLWPKLFQEISFIRNEAETMVSLGSYVLLPIYEEISRRTKISRYDMRYLTPTEIVKAVVEEEDFSSIIVRRKKAVFVITGIEDHEEEIIEGEEALSLFKSIYKRPKKMESSSLKGTPASLGKTKGKVIVVKNVDDFKKFNKGDILVSESTCIDYVPIMRIAGAVVTELGGITSHAAVVSRELGIPAVIGIPNVHLILKDGDVVEVDATIGMIKIVSK